MHESKITVAMRQKFETMRQTKMQARTCTTEQLHEILNNFMIDCVPHEVLHCVHYDHVQVDLEVPPGKNMPFRRQFYKAKS